MSIKSIPVLTGKTASKFIAEADNNKNQATPTLSEKAAERLKKYSKNQSRFRSKSNVIVLIPTKEAIATRLMYFDLKKP